MVDERNVIVGSCDVPEGRVTAAAAEELRAVARFLEGNAEALVGDMDSVYVLDSGLHFEFDVLRHGSIATVKVVKEFIAESRTTGKGGQPCRS